MDASGMGGGGGQEYSGSGSTSASQRAGGSSSKTDNSGGDSVTYNIISRSPDATASQTPGAAVNWYLIGAVGLALLGFIAFLLKRGK